MVAQKHLMSTLDRTVNEECIYYSLIILLQSLYQQLQQLRWQQLQLVTFTTYHTCTSVLFRYKTLLQSMVQCYITSDQTSTVLVV